MVDAELGSQSFIGPVISGDGRHVYQHDFVRIRLYERNPSTRDLTLLNGSAAPPEGAYSFGQHDLSPDGVHYYLPMIDDDGHLLRIYARDPVSSALTLVDEHRTIVDGILTRPSCMVIGAASQPRIAAPARR